jgi:hypothetical protein
MTRVAWRVARAVTQCPERPGPTGQPHAAEPGGRPGGPLGGLLPGEYALTMASGTQHRYPEFNLRFKTDGSRLGPEAGRPALVPAGMRGDRAQIIFAGLDDLKRFRVERC